LRIIRAEVSASATSQGDASEASAGRTGAAPLGGVQAASDTIAIAMTRARIMRSPGKGVNSTRL
jgi:hypothetical protein